MRQSEIMMWDWILLIIWSITARRSGWRLLKKRNILKELDAERLTSFAWANGLLYRRLDTCVSLWMALTDEAFTFWSFSIFSYSEGLKVSGCILITMCWVLEKKHMQIKVKNEIKFSPLPSSGLTTWAIGCIGAFEQCSGIPFSAKHGYLGAVQLCFA